MENTKEMIDYMAVIDSINNKDTFAEKVIQQIKQGWIPLGNITIDKGLLLQALIKYPPAEEIIKIESIIFTEILETVSHSSEEENREKILWEKVIELRKKYLNYLELNCRKNTEETKPI